jgi:glycerol-3-phosphate acyltransferase PlsY
MIKGSGFLLTSGLLLLVAPAALAGGIADDGLIRPAPLSGLEALAAYLTPAVVGYLLGSIPFGLLFTRLAGLGDIRTIGSGNIGATNVLRTGNKGLAAATLLLDAAKGTAAVLAGHAIGAHFGLAIVGSLIAGLAAFLGHIFPVWLGFKGGKGVATYIGVLAGAAWPGALAFCAVWLAAAITFRYSSLSALIASLAAPVVLFALGYTPEALLSLLLSALLVWKHAGNIERLRRGEEPKIGAKA